MEIQAPIQIVVISHVLTVTYQSELGAVKHATDAITRIYKVRPQS